MSVIEWLKSLCGGYSVPAEPWLVDGFTVASNGHCIVFVPALPESKPDPKAPNVSKWINEPVSGVSVDAEALRAFSVTPAPTSKDCRECDGDGRVIHGECDDCSGHHCEDCNGTGKVESVDIEACYGRFGTCAFDRRILAKILAGPLCVGSLTVKAPKDNDADFGAIHVFGSDWHAVMAGLRQWAGRASPDFFALTEQGVTGCR